MKFFVNYTGVSEKRNLFYDQEECSFNMYPLITEIDFDININSLNLTVVDSKVIQIWGFCGLNKKMNSEIYPPKSKKGILKVLDNLEAGFSYKVNKKEFPVSVNYKTGWVCIGESKKIGNGVEFINNCIAVIDDNQEISSLWLKPQELPNF